jgi:hypothetical protein
VTWLKLHKCKQKHKKYEKQDIICSPKANNSTIKGLDDHEADKILNNGLKEIMLRIVKEIEESTYKHLNEFKRI